MRIRNTFWYYIGLLFVCVIGGIKTNLEIFSSLFYVIIILIIVSYTWTVLNSRGISVDRYIRGSRYQLGEIIEQKFEITNNKRLPSVQIEIIDLSTLPGKKGSRIISKIGKNESRYYSIFSLLTKRGEFILGPTKALFSDPIGIFEKEIVFNNDTKLIVQPLYYKIKKFSEEIGILPGGKARRIKTNEITPYAASVREYEYGDSINRIHWPLSVKKNSLISKEFDNDPQSDKWVVIDANFSTHLKSENYSIEPDVDEFWIWKKEYEYSLPKDTFEYSISTALSIIHYYININQNVGFAINSKNLFMMPAERGIRQFNKIVELLSYINNDGSMELAGLLKSLSSKINCGSTLVVIASRINENTIMQLNNFVLKKVHPILVLIDPSIIGLTKKGVGSIQIIQEQYKKIIIADKNKIKDQLENNSLMSIRKYM